jgi:glucan biosynthesis protein C
MASGVIETPGTFKRPVSTLVANGVFFLFGWQLFPHRDALSRFRVHATRRVTLGLVFFAVHLGGFVLLHRNPETRAWAHPFTVASGALVTWLFLFGFIGLFERHFTEPNRVGRYLSEASYWLYLVHLPIVAWISGLLGLVQLPALVKYILVLGTTVVVGLLLYDLFVRPGPIGVLLNGRRRPRLLSLASVRRRP